MIEPYRYVRAYDPPPPPELIEALANQPLAIEVYECLACPLLADCRESYRTARRFARPDCSASLTVVLPQNDGNYVNQLVLMELRRAPGTVAEIAARMGIHRSVMHKIVARLQQAGRVTISVDAGKRQHPRIVSAVR